MAGSLIQMPSNGSATWEEFPDIVQAGQKQINNIDLTNWTSTSIPQVAAGSNIVINSAIYTFSANETIVDLAGVANSTEVWFKAVPSGSSCTVSAVTADASSWDADKGGYYDGNDRYFGGCYKDGSGNYTNKWLYHRRNRILNVTDYDGSGNANVNELVKFASGLFLNAGTYGTQAITSLATWTPSEGLYVLEADSGYLHIQVLDGATWRPTLYPSGAAVNGLVYFDGVNIRIKNWDTSTHNLYYLQHA